MTIESATVGEDVTLTVVYDNDATAADAAPTITITDNSDGTEDVSAVAMTSVSTGTYEYVWDTAGLSAGAYVVSITGEFSSQTKIVKDVIRLTD